MAGSMAQERKQRALKYGVPRKKRIAALTAMLPTHEERRAIIEAPMPVVTVHPKLTWGGTFIREAIPTDGRRVWQNTPEDEEWCRNKWEEK